MSLFERAGDSFHSAVKHTQRAAGSVVDAVKHGGDTVVSNTVGAFTPSRSDDDDDDDLDEEEEVASALAEDYEQAEGEGLDATEDHDELMRRFKERAQNPESVIEYIEQAGRGIDNKLASVLRGFSHSTVDKVLAGLGKSVERSVEVSGAPKAVTRRMKAFARDLWRAMLPKLRESLIGPVPGDYSAYLIRNWARRYPYLYAPDSDERRLLTWLRARVLYALYPADKTIFQKLRELPLYYLLMALKLDPVTGIPVFALQFYLIDRRDEYQLVNFILSFKCVSCSSSLPSMRVLISFRSPHGALRGSSFNFCLPATLPVCRPVIPLRRTFHFLTGIILAVLCAHDLFVCLYGLNDDAAIDGFTAATAAAQCNALMSSSAWYFPFQIGFEIPRIGLICTAWWLLVSGRTCGGPGELRALAEVRIDAADGTLDGYSDISALGRDPMLMTGRWGQRMPTAAEMDAAKDAARERFSASPGSGMYIHAFLLVDVAVLSFLVLAFGSLIVHAGWTTSDPMFWHTLYYLKLTYALSAWPFMAFLVPVFGSALHGASVTGYDMAGLCVPKLSNKNIRKKDALAAIRAKHEAKRAAKREANESPLVAKWRESEVRRWVRGLAGLNPFVRSAVRSDRVQASSMMI